MADAVTSQILVDGRRNCVMKLTNISDGTGEAAALKVDVSTLSAGPRGEVCTGVRIDKIEFNTVGMAVDLLWDATTDALAVTLPQDQNGCMDFCNVGGLQNNAGTGKTGDIMLTTIGHAAGDRYTIVLHMVKAY